MRRADRLFQIIQVLRRTRKPLTADAIAAELEGLWGAWVKDKYKSDDQAKTAWSQGAREAGPELLEANPNWYHEKHGGASAMAVSSGWCSSSHA